MAHPSKIEGYIKEYLAKNPSIEQQATKYEIPGFFRRKREEEEHRRVEEKTAESEKKYRTLVDNAQVGIYRTTLQGEILLANEALSRMLDYPSIEELKKGGSIAKYRDLKEREKFVAQLKEKGKVDGFETELLTRTGQVRTVIISSVLENNVLSGMVMDITERKRAEDQLNEKMHELKIINDAAVGRELKMIELEKEVNELLMQLGRKSKYK
jgi:PAS domain S-box-containing protein